MRSTATRVLAIVAAAACAAGLSSCRQGRGSAPEISGGDDTAVAGSSTGAPPGGADSTDSAEVRDIEPVTFTDEAIGLTETCDQIITDFKAPSYQKGDKADTTVYLLHCTLDFSGNVSFGSETSQTLTLIDDNNKNHQALRKSSGVEDDMKQAGLDPIDYDDYGTNHIDGWFAFGVPGKGDKADPLPEGATTLAYERDAVTSKSDGKTYEAYSTRAKVTAKNG